MSLWRLNVETVGIGKNCLLELGLAKSNKRLRSPAPAAGLLVCLLFRNVLANRIETRLASGERSVTTWIAARLEKQAAGLVTSLDKTSTATLEMDQMVFSWAKSS